MADETDELESYEVQYLRSRRIAKKGTVEYLVKWAGRFSDDRHDSWEPVENLRGTADFALNEYNRTHPDVTGFRILEQPSSVLQVSNQLSSAIGTFMENPSLAAYHAIQDAGRTQAGLDGVDQLLYDDATLWLKQTARSIAEKAQDHRSDLVYYAVLVEILATKNDEAELLSLVETILPLRLAHSFTTAACQYDLEQSDVLANAANALRCCGSPAAVARAFQIMRSQLLSLCGHIGRAVQSAQIIANACNHRSADLNLRTAHRIHGSGAYSDSSEPAKRQRLADQPTTVGTTGQRPGEASASGFTQGSDEQRDWHANDKTIEHAGQVVIVYTPSTQWTFEATTEPGIAGTLAPAVASGRQIFVRTSEAIPVTSLSRGDNSADGIADSGTSQTGATEVLLSVQDLVMLLSPSARSGNLKEVMRVAYTRTREIKDRLALENLSHRLYHYAFYDPQSNRRTAPTPCVISSDISLVVERLGDPAINAERILEHHRADCKLLQQGVVVAQTADCQPQNGATLAQENDPTSFEVRLRLIWLAGELQAAGVGEATVSAIWAARADLETKADELEFQWYINQLPVHLGRWTALLLSTAAELPTSSAPANRATPSHSGLLGATWLTAPALPFTDGEPITPLFAEMAYALVRAGRGTERNSDTLRVSPACIELIDVARRSMPSAVAATAALHGGGYKNVLESATENGIDRPAGQLLRAHLEAMLVDQHEAINTS